MATHTRIFIGLGSNLGHREQYLADALSDMQKSNIVPVQTSPIYQSEAWGMQDQAPFLNQVIEARTDLEPSILLRTLQSIEKKLGRITRKKWHEREIDLDILYYGDLIIDQPDLHIPHRYLHQRRFVLIPLQHIAPKFVDPQTGQTIDEMLIATTDDSKVALYKPTT